MAFDLEKAVWNRAERWLGKPGTPIAIKEAAWRLVTFLIKCGQSNPISFAVRPLVMSSKLRTVVGINLVILAVVTAIYAPLPTMAQNSGGPLAVVAGGEPEVNLATPTGVRVPISHYYVSQGFWTFHPGIDLATEMGTPIYPIMAGTVTKAEKNWFGYGNMVVVKHSNEYESLYAHMEKILVTQGQQVTTDTVLGLVGVTGRSTGPHLHLEIHENGKPVNPAPILGITTTN